MSIESKRVTKSLDNLREFLDFSEWIGRIPTAKSEDKYERRLAFWLIHMKQAKQGKSTCIWHTEMEQVSDSRGYTGIFTEDTRRLRFFRLTGAKIGGYEVIERSENVSPLNQVQWECLNGSVNKVLVSGYRLMRIRDCSSYSIIESGSSHLIGKKIGCWELISLYDFSQNERTIWYASRDEDGIRIINRFELPSLQSLTRCVNIMDGKSVDKTVDSSLGLGVEDMTGQKIGRWNVVGFSNKASNNECVWDCVCDCGTLSKVSGGKLRNGCSLSCGCLRKTIMARTNVPQ